MLAGNWACLAHLLRDNQDCAETYPDAVWSVQAQRPHASAVSSGYLARLMRRRNLRMIIMRPCASGRSDGG